MLRLAEGLGSLSSSSSAPEVIKILGGKAHVQRARIHGVSWGSESKREKMGEAWFAASSHFHFEQMCVKSLDRVPVDLDNSVYLLSFKESHRRTVMKSGAIVPFKAKKKKKKYILLEKTDGSASVGLNSPYIEA